MSALTIVEVAPRDGFQSVGPFIPTEAKVRVIEALAAAGVPRMEIGSFVSHKAIPQMADIGEVLRKVRLPAALRTQVLVPNGKGLQRFPDSKTDDDWGVRPDRGRELPMTPDLSRHLKEQMTLFALRPGKSREALDLDDPEYDTQRQSAVRMLREILDGGAR